ncbi:MAG: ATP-dependent DNA helicase RecG [Pseudomonadales bacterium]
MPATTTDPLASVAVSTLHGVGPKTLERLGRIGVTNVQDLLFHLPIRYEDRTHIIPIGSLRIYQHALFEGEIRASGIGGGRRRSLLCRVQDGTGLISIRLFHFSAAQKNSLSTGARVRFFGEIRPGPQGLECIHPEYQLIQEGGDVELAQQLTPVYPSTEGLQQASFRKLVQQALQGLQKYPVQNYLPLESSPSPISLNAAIRYLHAPPANNEHDLRKYQQRLAFEELVAHNVSLLQLRRRIQTLQAPALNEDSNLLALFSENLGFTLTNAQQRVTEELKQDLNNNVPTLRLVQGDVGCGKTVVAALAALRAISCGYQAALMAPTEILAEQHFLAFTQWFEKLGIRCVRLSGQMTAKQRQPELEAIASGAAQMIMGTHALIQESVQFAQLGLIVIDEQHRFGVHQRLTLRQKAMQSGICPHQIIMTATPIPRTLAMTAYADLDVSIIDELPPGRSAVTTSVLDNQRRAQVVQRVQQACKDGRQAYWVCTLIEESDVLQCQAAEKTALELQQALPELRIALLHGRMKAAEKAAMMASFKHGGIDLLVATTVIEVGLDVPNASLMIIENAERLGLAQIHQLRGRVGRGAVASHCVLMYQRPLSAAGKQRLQTLRNSSDGFHIAEQDLKLRGPGEVLGTRQTGMLQFRIADLQRDAELLDAVQSTAQKLLQQQPECAAQLVRRWLPRRTDYGNA